MLNGLRTHLMELKLFKEFCEEFTREVNRARIERNASIIGHQKELEKVVRDLDRAIQAILDGVPGAQLKDKIGGLEARKAELAGLLATSEEPPRSTDSGFRRSTSAFKAMTGGPRQPRCSGPWLIG